MSENETSRTEQNRMEWNDCVRWIQGSSLQLIGNNQITDSSCEA